MAVGEIYHVFNRSIADYKIFNNEAEYARMINTICYYQKEKLSMKLSAFIKSAKFKNNYSVERTINSSKTEKLVETIAYCIMPTHLHLILKELKEMGISIFMSNALNSYTRFFNLRHNRKGPLWEGRSKRVLVETDEQLMHLTRYIHLNPTTAHLVDKPEEWFFSSYKEYISKTDSSHRFCRYEDVLQIKHSSYKEFVENRISYQRELANIKKLLLE